MARLGQIIIFNEDETMGKNVQITEYEVEKGTPFSDHVRQTNPSFGVDGYIFHKDWTITEKKLERDMNNGRIMKYVGKVSATDVVIESYKISADKQIANGVKINLSLRKVRITKVSYQNAPKKAVPQRKPVTNTGEKKQTGPREAPNEKFHTVVKGDTYWYCSQKYGVSIEQLMKWNKYEAKKIPIGVKLRVG